MLRRRFVKPPRPQRKFILHQDQIIEINDDAAWDEWMQSTEDERLVERTVVEDMEVTTSFVGADRILSRKPQRLYSTEVKGGKANGMYRGYQTRAAAEAGHHEILGVIGKYFAKEESKKP